MELVEDIVVISVVISGASDVAVRVATKISNNWFKINFKFRNTAPFGITFAIYFEYNETTYLISVSLQYEQFYY